MMLILVLVLEDVLEKSLKFLFPGKFFIGIKDIFFLSQPAVTWVYCMNMLPTHRPRSQS